MAESQTQRLTAKRKLFESFEDIDDSAPDPGRSSSMQAMERVVANKKRKTTSATATRTSPIRRQGGPVSTSDPAPQSSAFQVERGSSSPAVWPVDSPSLTTRTTTIAPPASVVHSTPAVRSTKTTSKSTAATKKTGKRKGRDVPNPVPEERQIFRGLHFYFFPNRDTNVARRIRINKAKEYGATWEQEWNDSVTHVVVDRDMVFPQVLQFLKFDALPSHVAVASENWPAECLAHMTVLNPHQWEFKVKGHNVAMRPVARQSGSDQALQLKPAGRDVMARQPETPSPDREGFISALTTPVVVTDEGEHARPEAERPLGGQHVTSTPELDAVIEEARNLRHVSLDEDEEENGIRRMSSSCGSSGSDADSGPGSKTTDPDRKKPRFRQENFQCMHKNEAGGSSNPNDSTITILQQMSEYYGQVGDEWRCRAYRLACSTLSKHTTKVCTKEQALALPLVGERIATKIAEIAFTGRLRRLESARAEPSDRVLQTFMDIYGVGFKQASKWVAAGFASPDDLLARADLTNNQRIGIEHYHDFKTRIPRAEVEQHGNIVRAALSALDPAFEVIVGGSYRRGSPSSGDIDLIITRPGTEVEPIRRVVLQKLVPRLKRQGYLVAELSAGSRADGSRWMGASVLPPTSDGASARPWRRIDFFLVAASERGAGLIAHTGDTIFNRSMRLLASRKGYRLNQKGLYKDMLRDRDRAKLSEGVLVEGESEEKIFDILGVPWRPPEHRVC